MSLDIFPTVTTPSAPLIWPDCRVVPFPIPRVEPNYLAAIEPLQRVRARELWHTVLRLDLALGLVQLFPVMVQGGETISAAAQTAITDLVPELCHLRTVLDAVRLWPSRLRADIIPPETEFPRLAFEEVMTNIATVIARDTLLLEDAGALPRLRTGDGVPYSAGINFQPEFTRYDGRGKCVPSNFVSIFSPFNAEHAALWASVQGFRNRLETAPALTLAGLCNVFEDRHVKLLNEVRAFRTRVEVSPASTLAALPNPIVVVLEKQQEAPLDDSAPSAQNRHSDNYEYVTWNGEEHMFTPTQRAIVRLLWEAMEKGIPALSAASLIEGAGKERGEVRDVFRTHGQTHPAWGGMIDRVPGKKDLYRLKPSTSSTTSGVKSAGPHN